MEVSTKLESMPADARMVLAALGKGDPSVAALGDHVGALRYSEGVLVGFLEALVMTVPKSARTGASNRGVCGRSDRGTHTARLRAHD